MIEEYFEYIRAILERTTFAKPPEVNYFRRSKEVGFIRGDLFFKDGSHLHFREFVQAKRGLSVYAYMYVFQYMDAKKELIFRYDNADHYLKLPTAPHHKHIGEKDVVSTSPPTLEEVIHEIERLIA